jgi:hypothetical protein
MINKLINYGMRTLFILIIIASLGLISCKENNSNHSKIEIYLLKSYQKANNSYQITSESLVLNDTALIKDSEIYSYNKTNYTFKISENKAKWLNDFQNNKTHGRAFAITIDKTVIYTGYFWASYSSSSVDWVVIDPLNLSGKNELVVKIGYPGLFPGMSIPDLRNDNRIIDLMSNTNRLLK